jgi:hypothetical protein
VWRGGISIEAGKGGGSERKRNKEYQEGRRYVDIDRMNE